ncbi:excalibur calcium-binding domain-containing protein [Plantactinospora sp. KLBMP9567]|uniref:excalibur calcium-binding domain-containing protein n=1 Tax=Plantactinospora sp. KLBMP9567 TaxID=3085900 RepID=UPI002980D4CF|nr:excalibur calcium-binding domain-containing protein [Plantactinospora sp. KLBMP9567]MDW5327851.1 excalibur calcium-binding domain-containing protein [Plantactinospora sp. KLBMP9567]
MSYPPPPQDPWDRQPPPAIRGQQPIPGQQAHSPRPVRQPRKLTTAQQLGVAVLGIFGLSVLACCGTSVISALSPDDADPDREPAAAQATSQPTTPAPVVVTSAPEPTPPATTAAAPPPPKPTSKAPPKPVYYRNCSAVHDAGKAPLRKGQPGYRAGLDRDGDGRACESSEGPAPGDNDDGDDGGSSSVYYKNCTAVRAAGADPIRRGDPGYGRHLDRDGDGVGCE